MLSAPPRVFFRDLLHRLDGKMQGAVTARDSFEKRPKLKSRQKPLKEGAQDMREKRCKRTEMRDARRYPSPASKAGVSREALP
jgi:hypothetical protein